MTMQISMSINRAMLSDVVKYDQFSSYRVNHKYCPMYHAKPRKDKLMMDPEEMDFWRRTRKVVDQSHKG